MSQDIQTLLNDSQRPQNNANRVQKSEKYLNLNKKVKASFIAFRAIFNIHLQGKPLK